MTLGEIKENLESSADLAGDGCRTRMLISAAHHNVKETLAELRDLACGIHPPGALLRVLVQEPGLGVE